ncbi:PDR/VanB family oxidoreductase [Nocardioides hungaricus]
MLRRSSAAALPPWEPGAHVDVVLPDGTVRQFSLCGEPDDLSSYRIAVRREPDGRGGSRWVHEELTVGDVLQIRPPRNHFALEEASGYVFVAGGIGITPILTMARHVRRSSPSVPCRTLYAGRSRASMALLDEVVDLGEGVQICVTEEVGRPDVRGVVAGLEPEHLLYVCGPAGLIDDVRRAADESQRSEQIRYELFSAPVVDSAEVDSDPPFEVELRRSGMTIEVGPTSTILREVRAAGAHVLSDCQDGICGSCETAILEGEAEHRDHVLTPEEQRSNTVMMICVSRCRSGRLVLDL